MTSTFLHMVTVAAQDRSAGELQNQHASMPRI
jgi:hypothetical protein